jgi:hypothetical protein
MLLISVDKKFRFGEIKRPQRKAAFCPLAITAGARPLKEGKSNLKVKPIKIP